MVRKGLIIRRSQVRVLPAPPAYLGGVRLPSAARARGPAVASAARP